MRTLTLSVRCIGARTSARTIEALRGLTDKIIGLTDTEKYRSVATEAISGEMMRVYIPAGLTEESIDAFFQQMVVMRSHGNTTKGEPCYPDIDKANCGHNEDGSLHRGYLVVDVIERLVIDLIDRDGRTLLHTPLVQFATQGKIVP